MEEKKFFDFKSNENFNLNEEYSSIFGEEEIKTVNPGDDKLKDAEKIINELGGKYIESVSLQKYENLFLNLNGFLIKFRTESDEVKNMTREDRDKLFAYGRELFKSYEEQYGKLNFNFEISTKEWEYIDSILTKKLSYNGNELFNFWKLYTDFIEPTRDIATKLPKEIESFMPTCSIQSLVLLSHLMMKHEEKGSTKQFYHFKNILAEVGQMTRLFNAYGVMLERATNGFNNWVNALNFMDGYNNDDRMVDGNDQK